LAGHPQKSPRRLVAELLSSEVELAGKSTRQIAADLTVRGIPTPRGGRWQAQSVANVLRHLDMNSSA
jgi:Recombinase